MCSVLWCVCRWPPLLSTSCSAAQCGVVDAVGMHVTLRTDTAALNCLPACLPACHSLRAISLPASLSLPLPLPLPLPLLHHFTSGTVTVTLIAGLTRASVGLSSMSH